MHPCVEQNHHSMHNLNETVRDRTAGAIPYCTRTYLDNDCDLPLCQGAVARPLHLRVQKAAPPGGRGGGQGVGVNMRCGGRRCAQTGRLGRRGGRRALCSTPGVRCISPQAAALAGAPRHRCGDLRPGRCAIVVHERVQAVILLRVCTSEGRRRPGVGARGSCALAAAAAWAAAPLLRFCRRHVLSRPGSLAPAAPLTAHLLCPGDSPLVGSAELPEAGLGPSVRHRWPRGGCARLFPSCRSPDPHSDDSSDSGRHASVV